MTCQTMYSILAFQEILRSSSLPTPRNELHSLITPPPHQVNIMDKIWITSPTRTQASSKQTSTSRSFHRCQWSHQSSQINSNSRYRLRANNSSSRLLEARCRDRAADSSQEDSWARAAPKEQNKIAAYRTRLCKGAVREHRATDQLAKEVTEKMTKSRTKNHAPRVIIKVTLNNDMLLKKMKRILSKSPKLI